MKVNDGTIQYIGGRTLSLEIDEHMSYRVILKSHVNL